MNTAKTLLATLAKLTMAKSGKRKWDQPHIVLLFLLPAMVFTLSLIAYPAVSSAYYSFFNWKGLSINRQFIGLENWERLMRDPVILICLKNNIALVLAAVFITVPFAYFVAFFLARAFVFGRNVYRVAYFLPNVLTVSVVGVLWTWIYHPQSGLLNEGLRSVGLDQFAHAWLGTTETALPAVIIAMMWQVSGFYIILFMAAVSRVPSDIYDAAIVDGANMWQLALQVVAPMLRDVFAVAVTIAVVSSIKRFDLVYILTDGGPANATNLLAIYLFKIGIISSNLGYGSAIATFLFLLTLGLVVFQLRVMGTTETLEF
jgi:raffinose/stachyose/melibiose transport system permease protein